MTTAHRSETPTGQSHLHFVLPDEVGPALIRRLRAAMERHATISSLTLDASHVDRIEPVAPALLWLLCRDTELEHGVRAQLEHVPPPLRVQLRSHPLQAFAATEEDLFRDPFAGFSPSAR